MNRTVNFADLHCHPHGRAYNFMRNSSKYNGSSYNPWSIFLSNLSNQEKGKRAFSYSQCDIARLINGEVGIVFAALYPFEKGFFRGGGKVDSQWISKVGAVIQKIPYLGAVANVYLRTKLRPIVSSEESYISAKDFLQTFIQKMPIKRIEFIQNKNYDYYEELLEEYKFLKAMHNIPMKTVVEGPLIKRTLFNLFSGKKEDPSNKANGTYFIARNNNEIEQALNDGKLVFIITIEGMHSLGTDQSLGEVFNRIIEIKKWTFPVFFVTFSHHFNNYLCGHAHSLPNEGSLFAIQNDGMNGPFDDEPLYTNSVGMAAVRLLLGIGPDNKEDDQKYGKRILIDVKHMAARSRIGYYDLVRKCKTLGNNIPVIASHVGYTGVKKLQELVDNIDNETDLFQVIPGLNPWNINVCDEDIEIIVQTGGLLGLCLDQRVLGVRRKEIFSGKDIVWKNFKGFLDAAIFSVTLTPVEKSAIWKVICLGTDFEGYIDPVNEYATALDFKAFKADLINSIRSEIFDKGLTAQYFIPSGKTPEALAHDFCIGNVMSFLKINFK